MKGKHASHAKASQGKPSTSGVISKPATTGSMPQVSNSSKRDAHTSRGAAAPSHTGGMRPVSPHASAASFKGAPSRTGETPRVPTMEDMPPLPAMDFAHSEPSGEGKPRRSKAPFIAAAVAAVLLAGVYTAGVVTFSDRFYPNTTMGAFDLSMKTFAEASDEIAEAEKGYALSITGQGLNFKVSAADGGMALDADAVVKSASEDMNPFLWFVRIWSHHDLTESLTAQSDAAALGAAITSAVDAYNQDAKPSQDANVVYDPDTADYVVQDEVYGAQISTDAVVEQATLAMASLQDELKLGEDALIKPQVLASDKRLAKGRDAANAMVKCDVAIKSSTGSVIAEVNADLLSDWITFDENYAPVLNDAALNEWATGLASSLDTIGTTRTYTRPDGKSVTIGGGDYGWSADTSALAAAIKEAVAAGTVGEITVPCNGTGNGYTAPGQDWGAYCDVDLTEQHARYYDAAGSLIWESAIVSGKPSGGDDTPTGVYYLKGLDQGVRLKGPIDPKTNKPEWDSPVDYWMPFVGNMVGLHDAPWQPSSVFGDPNAYTWAGSHGCVNLPVGAAGELFGIIQIGDPVIVHW